AVEAVGLRLWRYAGGGVHEDVDLTTCSRGPVRFELGLELGFDFADQAETDRPRRQHGRKASSWAEGEDDWQLCTTYEASHRYDHQGKTGTAHLKRGLIIRFSDTSSAPRRRGQRITFEVELAPRATWHCCVDLIPVID